MPATATLTDTGDLLEIVSGWRRHSDLARQYVRLLERAATEGYPIGVQESTEWDAEALSDWDAAMAVAKDVRVEAITEVREALNRQADIVVAVGSRKGQTTYSLNNHLLT